jgi:hypothetical protein
MTNATRTNPWQAESWIKPDTQSWLGMVARDCLFTRSSGHGRACPAKSFGRLATPNAFNVDVSHQSFNVALSVIRRFVWVILHGQMRIERGGGNGQVSLTFLTLR